MKHFDKVYVMTLDESLEKFKLLKDSLTENGISFETFKATNGSDFTPPTWWTGGNGGWGCMNTHVRIWQDAFSNRHERVLIFEDDAILIDNFISLLDEFMEEVPEDWDQIYLGGQHRPHVGMISKREHLF